MHVVCHQGVRVDFATFAHRDFAKIESVAFVIDVRKEARPAVIPALHDVMRYVWKIEAGLCMGAVEAG
jgi:hypothetical protein